MSDSKPAPADPFGAPSIFYLPRAPHSYLGVFRNEHEEDASGRCSCGAYQCKAASFQREARP